MARRRLWRNDVVRSYWRTRHPLLRFLCLHEAVTSPFVVAISYPCDYPFALRRLPQWNLFLLAVKCHGVSSLYSAVRAFHRSRGPTQCVFCAWVFRTHVRRFMGPLTAKFASYQADVLKERTPLSGFTTLTLIRLQVLRFCLFEPTVCCWFIFGPDRQLFSLACLVYRSQSVLKATQC